MGISNVFSIFLLFLTCYSYRLCPRAPPPSLPPSLALALTQRMASIARAGVFISAQPLSCRHSKAKTETLDKVCEIVKQQLALPEGTSVTGESTFSALGADSLDTVEIVMGLEEAFGISVEEENAQSITTVQDAADLIEKLVEKKSS